MDPDLVLACRTIDPALLGGRIKEARLRAGLTQTQAAGSRMSTAYVSRIEAGQRRPDPELLQVLADNLGVDVEGLLTGLSRDAATELATRLQWAELSLSTGDAAAALRSVGDVLGEVSASTHESLEREARLLRARALESLGQYDDAIIGYEDLAETAARDLGWVRLMTALSRCHRETGDLARAIDVGDRAAQTIVELDLEGTTEAVQLTLTAAAAYFERGDTGHAARMCRRAVERADQLDTPVARASAYWNASVVESRRGNPRGALDLAREAVGLLDEGSEQRSLARLRTQLGVILLRQDPPLVEEALAALRAAETELATSDASPADLRENHLAQARALFLGGEPDAAERLAAAAPGTDPHPLIAAETHALLGQVAAARGDVEAARERYRAAVQTLSGVEADHGAAQLWYELGDLLEAVGEAALALDAFRRAGASTGLRSRGPVAAPGARTH